MSHRLRSHAAGDSGFTLIELLIVIIIIGILLAIAVPAYLGFKDRAARAAAQANVRAALPSIEAFGSDHVTGYDTLSDAGILASYDAGLKASVKLSLPRTYCVQSIVGTHTFHMTGPAGSITSGTC